MKHLLESGPKHCIGPPFSAGRILVRPDHRAVDERANVVVDSQRLEDLLPDAPLGPSGEAVIRGLPWTVSFRNVTPRCSGLEPPHHRVDERPVPTLGSRAGLDWQQVLHLRPLGVAELVSVHANSCSRPDLHGNFSTLSN